MAATEIQTVELYDAATSNKTAVRTVTAGRVTRDEAAKYGLRVWANAGAVIQSTTIRGNKIELPPGSYAGAKLTPCRNSTGTAANEAGSVYIVVAESAESPPVVPTPPVLETPAVETPAPTPLPSPGTPRAPLWGVAGIPTVAQGDRFGFQVARCFPTGIVGDNAVRWVASGRKLIVAMAKQPWPVNVAPAEVETWCHALAKGLPKGTMIEIGNEPNGKDYWKRSTADWVDRVLMPAAKLLKSLGIFTIGTAAADGNLATHQAMLAADPLVDAWAVHPYGGTVLEHKNRLAAIRAITAKPLYATEWNLSPQGGDPKTNWADRLQTLYDVAARYCDCLCYYRIQKFKEIVRFDDAALFMEDGTTENKIFVDAVLALDRNPARQIV